MTLPKGYNFDGKKPEKKSNQATSIDAANNGKFLYRFSTDCGRGHRYRVTFKGRKFAQATFVGGFMAFALWCGSIMLGSEVGRIVFTGFAVGVFVVGGLVIGNRLKYFYQNARGWECGDNTDATWMEIIFFKMIGKYYNTDVIGEKPTLPKDEYDYGGY